MHVEGVTGKKRHRGTATLRLRISFPGDDDDDDDGEFEDDHVSSNLSRSSIIGRDRAHVTLVS